MSRQMDKAKSFIVLDHPFFAGILLRHPMAELPNTPNKTLSCSYQGRISYNPVFFDSLPVKQGVFSLCHEILHYASMHHLRQGNRDHATWNMACDAWVNETLVEMKVGEPLDDVVRRPGAHTMTVENLYDLMKRENEQKNPPPGPGQPPPPGPGQPPPPGDQPKDDPLGDDVEPPPPGMTESEKKEQEAATKLEVAESAQGAKMRGNLHGLLQDMVAALVDSKVPWWDVLERYMVEKVAQDQSWARRNRRYPGVYLPTRQSQGALGEVVIQIDVSGSVSREEIAYYNGHMKRIVELCNPDKVHVLYTDTEVLKHEEFDRGEEFAITFHSGGGTDMEAGFSYISEQGIDPDVFVCLTDGYTGYDEDNAPDCPVIWCVSTDKVPPYGTLIPFTMHANDTPAE